MNPEVLEILSELKSNLQYEQLGLVAKLIVQILKMKDEVDVYKLLGVEKKPRKRKTILDDHPQVKQKVIQWIDEKFQLAAFTYSETAFKICDFQDFINSLFQSTNSNVKPISHTTVLWLLIIGPTMVNEIWIL